MRCGRLLKERAERDCRRFTQGLHIRTKLHPSTIWALGDTAFGHVRTQRSGSDGGREGPKQAIPGYLI